MAIIYLYNVSGGSFDIQTWHKLPLALHGRRPWCSSPSSLRLPSRCRCCPVHTWLPDVHVEAPTGGSAVLAAIMLKLGALRFLAFLPADRPGCLRVSGPG